MSDSPASSPGADAVSEADSAETVAFLPAPVSRVIIAAWIILFSGRWLVVQGMEAAGLLGADQVERLDNAVLGRVYLVLVGVTIGTLIVRFTRAGRAAPALDPPSANLSDLGAPDKEVNQA